MKHFLFIAIVTVLITSCKKGDGDNGPLTPNGYKRLNLPELINYIGKSYKEISVNFKNIPVETSNYSDGSGGIDDGKRHVLTVEDTKCPLSRFDCTIIEINGFVRYISIESLTNSDWILIKKAFHYFIPQFGSYSKFRFYGVYSSGTRIYFDTEKEATQYFDSNVGYGAQFIYKSYQIPLIITSEPGKRALLKIDINPSSIP